MPRETFTNAQVVGAIELALLESGATFGDLVEQSKYGVGVKTDLGFITHLESGRYLDKEDHIIYYTILKLGDQYFRVESTTADATSWKYPELYEVVQQAVTYYEYLPKAQ